MAEDRRRAGDDSATIRGLVKDETGGLPGVDHLRIGNLPVPGFIADAGWPQRLPNNWIMGAAAGVAVDAVFHDAAAPGEIDQRVGGEERRGRGLDQSAIVADSVEYTRERAARAYSYNRSGVRCAETMRVS